MNRMNFLESIGSIENKWFSPKMIMHYMILALLLSWCKNTENLEYHYMRKIDITLLTWNNWKKGQLLTEFEQYFDININAIIQQTDPLNEKRRVEVMTCDDLVRLILSELYQLWIESKTDEIGVTSVEQKMRIFIQEKMIGILIQWDDEILHWIWNYRVENQGWRCTVWKKETKLYKITDLIHFIQLYNQGKAAIIHEGGIEEKKDNIQLIWDPELV